MTDGRDSGRRVLGGLQQIQHTTSPFNEGVNPDTRLRTTGRGPFFTGFQTLTQLSRFVSPSLEGSVVSNERSIWGDSRPSNPLLDSRPQSQFDSLYFKPSERELDVVGITSASFFLHCSCESKSLLVIVLK